MTEQENAAKDVGDAVTEAADRIEAAILAGDWAQVQRLAVILEAMGDRLRRHAAKALAAAARA